MKPDGVTMEPTEEPTEPTEAAAVAEPLNQPNNSSEQASPPSKQQPAAAAPSSTAATVNGTSAAAKPKSATASAKKQTVSKTESAPGSRPGATSRHRANDVKPTNRTAPVKNPTAPSVKAPGCGTVPKKPLGASVGTSATRTQFKVQDKKLTGPAAAAALVSNGTKPGTNGAPKKTLPATKEKTAAALGRSTGLTAPKTGTSATMKSNSSAPVKTSRPATAPTSRPAAKPSTAAAAVNKPPSSAKTAPRAATAPSSGRTLVAQSNKPTAPAKKDISQPAAAAMTKKMVTASTAVKKTDVSKSVKSATSSAKVDVKQQPKPQQSTKPTASKKPAPVAPRLQGVNRVQTTSLAIPKSSSANESRPKQARKPTQAVTCSPVTKRTEKMGAGKAAAAAAAASNKAEAPAKGEVSTTVAPMAAAAVEPEMVEAVEPLQQGLKPETTEPEKTFDATSMEVTPKEPENNKVSSQSPVTSASSQTVQQPSVQTPLTTNSASAESPMSPGALPLQAKALETDTQRSELLQLTAVAENGSSEEMSSINLKEDEEEEEEKEGSQLISVSEMSGTTQPTEESRPGSAGPVGASAWRVGGALLSELDSEEVSVSQQGASELSAPGVLEGTESMDDLGESSLKGAMDMEGASAGSPDFEKVPDIPVNDYEDDDEEDDNNCVCDMDVGSERTDEPQRIRHDNDVDDDDEDEDVEMASEGVTESGLESYGNADEDDFAEDERLDNLNRVAQPPPPPPLLPSAPAAQWDLPNHFADPWAEAVSQQQPSEPGFQALQGAEAAPDSPLTDPCQGDSETPTQESTQTWLELGSVTFTNENQEFPQTSSGKKNEHTLEPQMFLEEPSAAVESTGSRSPFCASGTSHLNILSGETSTPEKINHVVSEEDVLVPKSEMVHDEEPVCTPAPGSNPSSSSVTEDEASDMEGEAQLEDSLENTHICNVTLEIEPQGKRCLSTVEESEEPEDSGAAEDATPPSATSQVSYGFDNTASVSISNAQSTGENCVKSPGIFSLEELPEELKEPAAQPIVAEQQPYIECGEGDADREQASDTSNPKLVHSDQVCSHSPEPQQLEQMNQYDDTQPPYYSAICEKTENSFAGFSALLHPQRRDHSSYPRTYCDIVKPVNAALASPKLSCADLPPRSPKQQPLSPQLRRLEQHQRHLLELQQRREQQSRPLEEAEQERKRREEEEERKKKDEAEEEIKRNKKEQETRLQQQEEEAKRQEVEQRKALELQLHQQQEELKQRQQIMQWQQELQESNKGQQLQLSPSGLCTIYEALEHSDDEDDGVVKCGEGSVKELNSATEKSSATVNQEMGSGCETVTPPEPQSTHNSQDVQRLTASTQNGDSSSTPPDSPERLSPLDLDWGKKADIVHQLINQTLLLNGDGCSSLLLLPGGAGGTLSPLESSLWPSLLPPLTPPSATVTSVSSFSPETSGSSPQGEWTVVELETHH